MSLTVTPPPETRLHFKHPHEFSPRSHPSHHARTYSNTNGSAVSTLQGSTPRNVDMTTHHRGLPPPAAMALPDPQRQPSLPPSLSSNFGQVSRPSTSHYQQPSDDSTRNSQTAAKAEEDKRRQEEEKTKQEELRLEQRKIEHTMLRDSISMGVPPHLVPMIFAGLAGGNLASAALDMAQQYLAQFQQMAPQPQPPTLQSQSSGERVRDPTSILPQQPPHIPSQQQPASQGTPNLPHSASSKSLGTGVYPSPSYTSPPDRLKSYGLVANAPVQSSLPKLTTNDPQVHGPTAYASSQTGPTTQEAPNSSPIFFHHWQPSQSQSNQGSKKDPHKASPNSSGNLSSNPENSPKKRKAQGPHEPAPVPNTNQSNSARRTAHMKQGSGSGRGNDPIIPTPLRDRSSNEESTKESTRSSPPETRQDSQEPELPTSASTTKVAS